MSQTIVCLDVLATDFDFAILIRNPDGKRILYARMTGVDVLPYLRNSGGRYRLPNLSTNHVHCQRAVAVAGHYGVVLEDRCMGDTDGAITCNI